MMSTTLYGVFAVLCSDRRRQILYEIADALAWGQPVGHLEEELERLRKAQERVSKGVQMFSPQKSERVGAICPPADSPGYPPRPGKCEPDGGACHPG